MAIRAPSLGGSENGVDITGAIVQSAGFEEGTSKQEAANFRPLVFDEVVGEAASDSDDAAFIAGSSTQRNRKSSNLKGRSVKKGGGFQSFGLNANLLKAITRKGFSVPTPIQRKTIPLIIDGQDVVGMARTGSGKTAAFTLPMLEKLKSHSARVGARALILSPSRELALQTLKVVKDFGKGSDLRCVLLVGGDSLEEQFGIMASNPDIVIATPGRFLHLKIEMGLDLSSVQYVVFDEADRLFEMGFAAQLGEILHHLPAARQTLLFSATLPKSLVEFAKAGLQDPHLVRLDVEQKISPDLQSAFFTVKSAEKEGALLHILHDIIHTPVNKQDTAVKFPSKEGAISKKRKREEDTDLKSDEKVAENSTIIFTATKHHVEYLAALLRQSGFAVSHVYGALDQTARKIQVQNFRTGLSNILVVTDVAARGIDIPILANVINYDFPAQPKIFVHRVGRTARAGRKGWSYSLVRDADAPYLLDLQLFLAKKLSIGRATDSESNYVEDLILGAFQRNELERNCEWAVKLLEPDVDLPNLRLVAAKGEKLYLKTRNAASPESARRAKSLTSAKEWAMTHPLFSHRDDRDKMETEDMLARISSFKPQETVFEIGRRGAGGNAAEVMRRRRDNIKAARRKRDRAAAHNGGSLEAVEGESSQAVDLRSDTSVEKRIPDLESDASSVSSDELEVTISGPSDPTTQKDYEDNSFFMSYKPIGQNIAEDRAYGVRSGSTTNANFLTAAHSATMDLTTDEGGKGFSEASRTNGHRWDKRSRKYVARANDEDGSKGVKYIRGESGQKIAASFRSGRYADWKRANKVERIPRVGDNEISLTSQLDGGRRWKHRKDEAPKAADKYRDDYHKRKKKVESAKEARRGRFRDGVGKSEIKDIDGVRKERRFKEKRREKSGKGKKGRRAA